MKPIEEILKDTRLESVKKELYEHFLVGGYLRLRERKATHVYCRGERRLQQRIWVR